MHAHMHAVTAGKGMWGRNVELKEFVERIEIMAPEGKPTEFHEMLGLFEKEVVYSIEAEYVSKYMNTRKCCILYALTKLIIKLKRRSI